MAAKLANLTVGDNKGAHRPAQEGSANLQTLTGVSQADAAKMLNVSTRSMAAEVGTDGASRNAYASKMVNADEYLKRTESATRHLFAAVASYIEILRKHPMPVYVSGQLLGDPSTDERWQEWVKANAEEIRAAKMAHADFSAEFFSMSMVCGAILQIAEKGLELYAPSQQLNARFESWAPYLGKKQQLAKYCIGRTVRNVPIGLIIYAGRNQHVHFEDPELREPSSEVIKRLATAAGYSDPALEAGKVTSLATNLTHLLTWRSYDAYLGDMQVLLNVPPA